MGFSEKKQALAAPSSAARRSDEGKREGKKAESKLRRFINRGFALSEAPFSLVDVLGRGPVSSEAE